MDNYLPALAGGIAIGIASVLMLALLGRIAGISGIFWGALTDNAGRSWRVAFLVGLLAGAWLVHRATGLALPTPEDPSLLRALVAGALVGVGVRLGNGCTSGHGVCGIGLLSQRSIVATLTFMATAGVTVAVLRHGAGVFS